MPTYLTSFFAVRSSVDKHNALLYIGQRSLPHSDNVAIKTGSLPPLISLKHNCIVGIISKQVISDKFIR